MLPVLPGSCCIFSEYRLSPQWQWGPRGLMQARFNAADRRIVPFLEINLRSQPSAPTPRPHRGGRHRTGSALPPPRLHRPGRRPCGHSEDVGDSAAATGEVTTPVRRVLPGSWPPRFNPNQALAQSCHRLAVSSLFCYRGLSECRIALQRSCSVRPFPRKQIERANDKVPSRAAGKGS
jgi:hypothetical protein